MATTASWESGRPFSVGEVINRAFAVIGENPLPTFGIAFLFGALPQQLFQFATESLRAAGATSMWTTIALTIASALLSMILSSLVAGAIVRITIVSAEGGKAGFGESAAAGLAKALPLFGLSVLLAIGLALGFLLLIVPGVILLVLWSVASPALVAEDLGVIEAFGRSRQLTKGARWRVFGLGLLLTVIFWLLAAIVGIAMIFTGGMTVFESASIPFLIVSAVAGTLSSAFLGAVQTNLYLALRDWKDGPRAVALAEVFA